MENGAGVRNPRARQRALAIGVAPSADGDGDPLAELKELLRTAGVATAGELVQVRAEPDPDRYLGRGKLAELRAQIKRDGANLVACDDELVPRQERNLEAALDVPVIDRTAIILDIFADHAHSAEGKLQVELAQLEYNLARMRGLWTHLERLGAGRIDGGIGTRGPGESQIETDRRLARDRITTLRRRLVRVERNRGVQRARREASTTPTVALAGYTNAGKSTLLGALTDTEVHVADAMFATLDPTSRRLRFPHEREVIVTDTVGFIRDLPPELVAAFRATLEEISDASLLLHVVDASAPDYERRIAAVHEVLRQIGMEATPELLVFNQIDRLEPEAAAAIAARHGGVPVSALRRHGLTELVARADAMLRETLAERPPTPALAQGG